MVLRYCTGARRGRQSRTTKEEEHGLVRLRCKREEGEEGGKVKERCCCWSRVDQVVGMRRVELASLALKLPEEEEVGDETRKKWRRGVHGDGCG